MKINTNRISPETRQRLHTAGVRTGLSLADLMAHAVECGAETAIRNAELGQYRQSAQTNRNPLERWFDSNVVITGADADVVSKAELFYDYMAWCHQQSDATGEWPEDALDNVDDFAKALSGLARFARAGDWEPSKRRWAHDPDSGEIKQLRAAVGLIFKPIS